MHQAFLAGLALNLREVLTVINGTAQLSERRLGAAPMAPDATLVALGVIRNAATQMALQISRLDDFAIEDPNRAPAR